MFRSRDKTLGETLVWIVDDLLQDESNIKDRDQIRLRKRGALESLSYVRDVLITKSMEIDEDRLMGGARKAKRKSEAQATSEKFAATTLGPLSPATIEQSQLRVQSKSKAPMENTDVSRQTPTSHTRSRWTPKTSLVPSATVSRPPTPISTDQKIADQKQPKTEDYMDPLGVLSF